MRSGEGDREDVRVGNDRSRRRRHERRRAGRGDRRRRRAHEDVLHVRVRRRHGGELVLVAKLLHHQMKLVVRSISHCRSEAPAPDPHSLSLLVVAGAVAESMPSAVDQLSTLARPRASRAGAQEGEAAAQGVPSSHRRRWHWRNGKACAWRRACSCTTPRASTCVYASGSGASRRRNLCPSAAAPMEKLIWREGGEIVIVVIISPEVRFVCRRV